MKLSEEIILQTLLGARTRLSAAVWLVVRDTHGAEDIFQDITLKAMRGSATFESEAALLSWAFITARRQGIGGAILRDVIDWAGAQQLGVSIHVEKANPARIWVQVATGANARALAADFGKFAKKSPDLFKGKSGATAEWGRTRRLLVGPFKDRKAAQDWLTGYKKAGGDGFLFNSEAGQAVDPI